MLVEDTRLHLTRLDGDWRRLVEDGGWLLYAGLLLLVEDTGLGVCHLLHPGITGLVVDLLLSRRLDLELLLLLLLLLLELL